jgi:peptidoglycan-associated lipoprotein
MKVSNLSHLLLFALIFTIPAVGCRKKPSSLTPLPGARAGQVPEPGPAAPISPGGDKPVDTVPLGGITSNDPDSHKGWLENAEMFKSETVHFDFDSSVVKSGEKGKVAKVADYLKSNAADAVRVEGNCDERGTEEYNRALGERRALALREELVRLGVDPKRVDTISYGEDKPVDPGHDESAWRKNRRGDFVLLSPPK